MCSSRDYYLSAFSRLRTHGNRTVWPAETLYRAPYKPFLLLAVLSQFNRGMIHRNFIEPSRDLEQIFMVFCNMVRGTQVSGSMASPFISLQGSGFWALSPREDREQKSAGAIRSVQQLRHLYFGARLDDDLFPLLLMEVHRTKFMELLVTTFFDRSIQPQIRKTTEGTLQN